MFESCNRLMYKGSILFKPVVDTAQTLYPSSSLKKNHIGCVKIGNLGMEFPSIVVNVAIFLQHLLKKRLKLLTAA